MDPSDPLAALQFDSPATARRLHTLDHRLLCGPPASETKSPALYAALPDALPLDRCWP